MLSDFLKGSDDPLIVHAADPLLSFFVNANSHPALSGKHIQGSPKAVNLKDIEAAARAILDEIRQEDLAAFWTRFNDLEHDGRASIQTERVARAATFGAVDTLLIDMDETVPGTVCEKTGDVTFAQTESAYSYGVIDEIAARVLQSGGMPETMTPKERMERKLRTKRGQAIYRQRGAAVEPVFGQMKDRQRADRFSMRGLERCRGEWQLDAAVHNLRKLHRDSVKNTKNQEKIEENRPNTAWYRPQIVIFDELPAQLPPIMRKIQCIQRQALNPPENPFRKHAFRKVSLPIVCIINAHKEPAMSHATAEKRRTNITLNATSLAAARDLGLNVSAICDAALAEAVRAARVSRWQKENAAAIAERRSWIERMVHHSPIFRS